MGLANVDGRERKGVTPVLLDYKSPGSAHAAQTRGRAQKKGPQQHLCLITTLQLRTAKDARTKREPESGLTTQDKTQELGPQP